MLTLMHRNQHDCPNILIHNDWEYNLGAPHTLSEHNILIYNNLESNPGEPNQSAKLASVILILFPVS